MGQHRTKQQKQTASLKRLTQSPASGPIYSIHPLPETEKFTARSHSGSKHLSPGPDLAKFIRNDLLKTLLVSFVVAGALAVASTFLR